MTSSKNIRLMRSSVIYGPFSSEQINHFKSTGQIKSTDLASIDNGPWRPIKLSENNEQQKRISLPAKPRIPTEPSPAYRSRKKNDETNSDTNNKTHNANTVAQKTIESINKWSCTWSNSTIPKNIMNNSQVLSHLVQEHISIILLFKYRSFNGLRIIQPCNTTSVTIEKIPETLFECRPEIGKNEQEKARLLQLGNIRSCPTCCGNGHVKCGSCNGAGKKKCGWCDGHGYNRSANNEIKPCTSCSRGEINCHCGNGQIRCTICSGFGSIKDVFCIIEKKMNMSRKFTNYNGCIPEKMINESTGSEIHSTSLEYPTVNWQDSIKNKDQNCYEKTFARLIDKIKFEISTINDTPENISFLKAKIDEFVLTTPDPTTDNLDSKEKKTEIIPQLFHVSVEEFKIEKIEIRYKSRAKTSTLYVFGNELSVHAENMPFAITPRLLAITLLYLIAFSCCCVFPGRIIYNKNNENTPDISIKKTMPEPRFVEPRAPQKLPDPPKAPARIEVESPKREDKK